MSLPIFDAYLAVDWSAANKPCSGKDSLWYALLERDHVGRWREAPATNLPTRVRAREEIGVHLARLVASDQRVLVGCDFTYGFPRGVVQGLTDDPAATWRDLWNYLARSIVEGPRNQNNRFEVAASMNRKLSGRAAPFWGCHPSMANASLSASKPAQDERWSEFRVADMTAAGARSPLQIFYNGSVGSQSLTGIPVVASWRDHPLLAGRSLVWPFETGLARLERPGPGGWRVMHAEVFPSLLEALDPDPSGIKDAAQVATLVRRLACLDEHGLLADRFDAPPALTPEQRARIEREEGWILDPRGAPAIAADAIVIQVQGAPPAKDGGSSIFNPAHAHHPLVAALRAAAQVAMAGRQPFADVPLRLQIRYARGRGRSDGANVVNGIADVLQRRPTATPYASEAWAYDDDANVREIDYREWPAAEDAYVVTITRAQSSSST